ncbi:ATP-binding protein [Bremerella cremea]|uniref:ATPase AAA-type core domain-containing protein n=1 Tax=Blastopirellula marina TaxID=124 RepID=A0A2S8FZG7_9BACT|nr:MULTISPECIES: AAA family ATPase [Pirellulaceae]PQO37585.1 hypothetical protein C5Y83_06470 [Blastopirellula marina]RCS49972.1 ATP-binding protein [Bremerella cremea]
MTDFENYSIKFKDLKCFGENPEGFETIKPINLIVGRNNSGKSTLLDCLPFLMEGNVERSKKLYRDLDRIPGIEISAKLVPSILERVFKKTTSGGIYRAFHNLADFAAIHLEGKRLTVETNLSQLDRYTFVSLDDAKRVDMTFPRDATNQFRNDLVRCLTNPFRDCTFHRMNPERRLLPEVDRDYIVKGDGTGATTEIQRFLNKDRLPREMVTKNLREQLNDIVRPDASFKDILAQQLGDSDEWEIFLDEENKNLVPLSNSGHGLQTIILVLVHTILLTRKSGNLNRHVFAFEELENNLHPSLLRRLLVYIRSCAVEKGATIFITTHSQTAIDFFRSDEAAQIVHVTHDGNVAECRTLTSFIDHGDLLDDLDVRASDILQSNCVIWVEGPSDRILINRWIEIASEGMLKEGIHYQCVFYGGRLLSHLSADAPDMSDDDVVKILTLNRKACVVMDSDKKTKNAQIGRTKLRIQQEVEEQKGIAWITEGREVENYVSPSVMQGVLELDELPKITRFQEVYDRLDRIKKGTGTRERRRKPEFAKRIAESLDMNNWKVLDLETRVRELCQKIRAWNGERE